MTRVLAVGLDAAESTVVARLLADGRLPVLRALLDRGTWNDLRAPADIGSGAVWPTFATGRPAAEHGCCGHWRWDPEAMRLVFFDGIGDAPFWARAAATGHTVGVLDVPFAPVGDTDQGFGVHEWGVRDAVHGRVVAAPESCARLVADLPSHPFSQALPWASGPDDREALAALAATCREGVRRRGALARRLVADTSPDLTIVVFAELHQAGHHLAHTVSTGDELPPRGENDLLDLYEQVDGEIGGLVDAAGPDTALAVFSLHGMRAERGIPTLLDDLLHAWGETRATECPPLGDRVRLALRRAKAAAPEPVKRLYRRATSASTRHRVAGSTMLTAVDWGRTRAVALPSDQHGWLRLNVAGRERRGIVSRDDLARTLDELEERLRGVRDDDGAPLVRRVVRTGGTVDDHGPLPDLLVHWAEAAFANPVRCPDLPGGASRPTTWEMTGNHTGNGFLVADRRLVPAHHEAGVRAEDLHCALIGAPHNAA